MNAAAWDGDSGLLASPAWLWLLVVVAFLVVGYVLVLARRRTRTVRFANLALLEQVIPRAPGRARHAPVALVLVALVIMIIALSGPQAREQVPRERATVLVIIDVSLSMRATDVSPTRLAVAQDAATQFGNELPPTINLGLMSFAGTTNALVTPTRDRDRFRAGVAGLQLAESTATGDAIQSGLALLRSFGAQVPGPQGPPPARMILLSDGKQTVPTTDPGEPPRGAFPAADQARAAGVPIYAVSFGTEYGTVDIDGQPVAVPAADGDMNEIAQRSGGQFYRAASDPDLRAVYQNLASQIGYETATVDATRPWLLSATVLLITALATAFVLGQRLP